MMAVFSKLVLTSRRTINIFITLVSRKPNERVRLVHVRHKFCRIFWWKIRLSCNIVEKTFVPSESRGIDREREREEGEREWERVSAKCANIFGVASFRVAASTVYIACRNHIKNFSPEKNFYNQLPTIFQFSCKFRDDILYMASVVCIVYMYMLALSLPPLYIPFVQFGSCILLRFFGIRVNVIHCIWHEQLCKYQIYRKCLSVGLILQNVVNVIYWSQRNQCESTRRGKKTRSWRERRKKVAFSMVWLDIDRITLKSIVTYTLHEYEQSIFW